MVALYFPLCTSEPRPAHASACGSFVQHSGLACKSWEQEGDDPHRRVCVSLESQVFLPQTTFSVFVICCVSWAVLAPSTRFEADWKATFLQVLKGFSFVLKILISLFVF